jgi:hypothetical protein
MEGFVVHIFVLLMFIILSATFSSGRGSSLIAGYNTASEEEKNNFDEKALCRFMGMFSMVLGLCYAFLAISIYFLPKPWFYVSMVTFFAATIAGVIYANTGGRFLKKNSSNNGEVNNG